MANTATNRLTRDQRNAIHSTLEAALTSIGDKLYEYREGYSDETIAKRMGVLTRQVSQIRTDWFGNLKKGGFEGMKHGEVVHAVKELNKRMAALEARMSGMAPVPTHDVAASTTPRNVPITNGTMR